MPHEQHCVRRIRLAVGHGAISAKIFVRNCFSPTIAVDTVAQADLNRCDAQNAREHRNRTESLARDTME
jgi:hypothetical protein